MRLEVREFIAANVEQPDPGALTIAAAVVIFSCFVVTIPLSESVRRAAIERFQLVRWPLAAWMLFQPVPAMYNFENRWEVVRPEAGPCPEDSSGFINHHVYNRIALFTWRLQFRQCQLPARVTLRTTYRGTTLQTSYLVDASRDDDGLTVLPMDGS